MTEHNCELKPCPFCGYKDIKFVKNQINEIIKQYFVCICGAQGPWSFSLDDNKDKNYQKCVEFWNERFIND